MDNRGFRLCDLGSKNGTELDGVQVIQAIPRDGSSIRVGGSALQLKIGDGNNPMPVSERTSFGGLVGESVAIRTVFALLERVANSEATVLLEGETGTGKEAAARSIHEASSRAAGPYVIVDCGAIPGNLLESELFGHEKGAFTGAVERRIGVFEEANGGTIFLDEIGELPLELQPKLLRVLESRQVRRIGANDHREMNVRIVAATNRDLRQEVNEGRFRSDLFFRLGVVRIRLPPLRERPDDIPVLALHLLDSVGVEDEQLERFRDPEFLSSLLSSAWVGNVRELRNYIEQCVVLQDAVSIDGALAADTNTGATVDLRLPYTMARRANLDAFERRYVEGILRLHKGNVTRAARDAGIGRVYFYKLLNKHGLRE
jgi:DNA-binding NtrC family response regulator